MQVKKRKSDVGALSAAVGNDRPECQKTEGKFTGKGQSCLRKFALLDQADDNKQ